MIVGHVKPASSNVQGVENFNSNFSPLMHTVLFTICLADLRNILLVVKIIYYLKYK